MTDTVVVEGQVKFRDGKKWKSRWVALRKPSPVADCLLLLAYKDKADKAKGHKERSSVTLEDIYGLEPIVSYEGLPYTLAILCLSQPVMLGFESRDSLLAWDARIRYSLGEVHRFSVGVQPGTKLESGPATLHLCNNLLGIARDLPPVIAGQWKLSDLRRYGAVPNGFVFEGGTRCGYWAGVFFLSCSEGEQISFLFDCIVRGISPTRGPFGLRPSLPDPSADPALAEQRLNLEAQELEKRLSMLSHCSRQSSSASTYSYGTSVTGDDRSISSSSSEASQSDTSIGSRLTMWAEPVMSPAPAESLGPPPGRGALHGEEKLYAAGVGGARVPAKPPRSRRLQEIGRQSSSDSGIATGSHSSYTGSFSSYAGSIDTSQGDEFGSLLSLPPSHAPSDQGPCSCPAPEDPGAEYQAPAALRQLYDTPRSLFQGPPPKDQASLPSSRPPGGGAWGGASTDSIPKWPAPQSQGQASDCPIGQTAPSADLSGICSPQPGIPRPLFEACPVCGGLKGTLPTQSGVLAMPAIPGLEAKGRCQCGPASRAEYQWTTEDTGDGDPPTASRLHGNGPWQVLQRTNGTEALRRNLQKQQNPLGLFSGLYGQHHTAGHRGSKTGGLNVYETMTSALRCGLRTGPHSSRRSWRVWEKDERNESRGGGNIQTSPPSTGLPSDVPSSPPLGPGKEALPQKEVPPQGVDGSTPMKPDMERGCSPPDIDRLCQEVIGHSATEDDKKPQRKEDCTSGVVYEITEGCGTEKSAETEDRGRSLEMTGSRGQQKILYEAEGAASASSTSTSKVHRQSSATDPKGSYEPMASTADPPKRFEPCAGEYGGAFVFPPEASHAGGVTDRSRGDGVTYVNIPISPTSKKQLHYMELELQEPGSGVRGNPVQLRRHRGGSTKYAQIDIAATETAHRVGSQHAQGREDRLQELEQKRKGAQQ
ncbi:protein Dok-7 isoform X1 [Conger conger]|uniref:protein Dok-7 isoform X1 n=1 Tax=Conger conger TaxID=82655 RepID=UPI002A5A6E8F|nr:protein Dok-7 isoform X1 [Conger conger]